MIVTHPVLQRILKRMKLSADQAPSGEQWHEILKLIDRNFHDADQVQYLNELSISVSSKEMAAKNKELTNNIEKLNRLQHKLIQSEKMATIGQISAGIAHEINNPLSFSLANIGVLRKRFIILKNLTDLINHSINNPTNHVSQDLDKEIANFFQNNRVYELIEDLDPLLNETKEGLLRIKNIVEALSRFSNTKIDEMKLVDINSCILSALDICRSELSEKCEIVLNLGSVPKIIGLLPDLEVVFIHLLLNAIKSITDHGKITVSSASNNNEVIITVEDNGCGIDPEHINKIFNPFYSTRPVGSGVGLGLTIAYGIVELHHGQIHVESKPNQGSIFTITLPVGS